MAQKARRQLSEADLKLMRENLLQGLAEVKKAINAASVTKRARERAKARKDDARNKLLHGVILLSAIEAGYVSRDQVMGWGAQFIKRAGEREFLGLPPLPEEQQRQEE